MPVQLGIGLLPDSTMDEAARGLKDREAVSSTVAWFEAGSGGFADGLVVATHARHGRDQTATIDCGMRKLTGAAVGSDHLPSTTSIARYSACPERQDQPTQRALRLGLV